MTEAASLLGKGAYQLSDEGQSIWVVDLVRHTAQGRSRGCDGPGTEGFDLGGLKLPNVLGGGVVLVESSHHVHD